MVFKIRRGNGPQPYFFNIVASNGRTLAHSESYYNKQDAVHAAQVIMAEAATATIDDAT